MCHLTTKERKLLQTLRVSTVPIAAESLGISVSTVYVVRHRIRAKEEECKDFLKELKRFRTVLGTRR